MPKPTLLLALLAICALLGVSNFYPATTQAAQSVRLKVAFEPDKPGVRTTISLALHISGARGGPPSALTSVMLRMPENMGLATTTLGQANCYPRPLLEEGLAGCSENARLGFGDAVAVVPLHPDPIYAKASLTALMGPPASNRIEILFYAETLTPVFAQFVFPGLLEEDARPFGDRLDTTIPLVQPWPEGPYIALTSFNSTIGPLHLTYHRQVNGKWFAYKPHGLLIPKHCPPDGYPFAAILTFQDGTTSDVFTHVACPDQAVARHGKH